MGRVKQALEKRHMNGELEHRREMATSQEGEMAAGRGRASVCLGFSWRVFVGHREAPRIPRGEIIEVHGSSQHVHRQWEGPSGTSASVCPAYTNLLSAKPTFSGVPSLDEWPQPLHSSPTPARIWISSLDPHISYAINDRVLLDSISKVSL